jgi:hypothetical protein
MRKTILVSIVGLLSGVALLLAGCGDSHPIAPPGSAAVAALPSGSTAVAAASPDDKPAAHIPAAGVFTVAAKDILLQPSEPSGKCNLDVVDGAPAGSKPVPHGGSALFAGWAGANDGAGVPAAVTIVLHGAQDFAVQASTGSPRPDVAAANHMPALANSGYAVNASMAAVSAGHYQVELRFTAAGKAWRCESTHALTVE